MQKPFQKNEEEKDAQDKFYDNDIEWDDIQDPNAEAKNNNLSKTDIYKIKLKEISDDEKNKIIQQIEQQETLDLGSNVVQGVQNYEGQSASSYTANTSSSLQGKPINIEQLENQLLEPELGNVEVESEQKPLDIRNIEKQQLSKTNEQYDIHGNSIEDMFDDNDEESNKLAISKENQDQINKDGTKEQQKDQIHSEALQINTNSETNDSAKLANTEKDINLQDAQSNKQIEENSEQINIPEKNIQNSEIELEDETKVEDEKDEDYIVDDEPETQEAEGEEIDDEEPDNIDESLSKNNQEELTPEQQYMVQQQYEAFQKQHQMQQNIMHQNLINSQMQSSFSQPGLNSQNTSYMYSSKYSIDPSSGATFIQEQAPLSNPFDNILKQNSTSHWFYKDPSGQIRGAFTTFDMHTWYNEGYFNEDLEISLDYQHFFKIKELRVLNQTNNNVGYPSMPTTQNQYASIPQYQNVYANNQNAYGYSEANQYQNQIYGTQMQQNINYQSMQDIQNQIAYQNYIQQQQIQGSYPKHGDGNYW